MVFLIIQDLRSKFTTHGSILFLLWKFASGKLRWLSWNDEIEGVVSIFIGLWITFSWLFKAGLQKSTLQISANVIFEFQKATHACAFCFCLGVSCTFALDTSPKRIDREGLGKRLTWTRQNPLVVPVTGVKFNRHSCMSNEQWIFYENFSLFGQMKIFEWIKLLRRHLRQIQGNWGGRNFITASRVNSRLITHARMQK